MIYPVESAIHPLNNQAACWIVIYPVDREHYPVFKQPGPELKFRQTNEQSFLVKSQQITNQDDFINVAFIQIEITFEKCQADIFF